MVPRQVTTVRDKVVCRCPDDRSWSISRGRPLSQPVTAVVAARVGGRTAGARLPTAGWGGRQAK
jgi:hypothetical protein